MSVPYVNQYQKNQVETASPEDLVVMLYDGARRFTDQALAALQQERYQDVSLYTGKAQRILAELQATLNFEAGGEIAHNLNRLYDYWIWRLSQGILKKDQDAFREVSATLADMRDAWAEAAKQVRAQRGMRSFG
jgi:flagellar protein FliS